MSPSNNNKESCVEFTEIERAKLIEFRKRVHTVYQKPDTQLIRWLRARKLDVTKAEQMLRKHLTWRRNNQIDAMVMTKSAKVFAPFLHLGSDFDGSPVVLFPLGRYEVRVPVESGDLVGCLRFIYQAIEHGVELTERNGTNNIVLIIDCEGFRYNQFTNRFLVQVVLELGRMVEANYPEFLKIGFVLNAPRLFNALFALIKPVLASETVSKVHVNGSDKSKWLKDLLKHIPKEIIPPYWGGTRSGTDEFCSESWFQEPLPRYFTRRLDSVMDAYGQEWISLKIAAGECLTFEYNITEEQLHYDPVLTWAFYSDGYDLAFGLTHEDQDVVEQKRVNSHKSKQTGSHSLDKPGKYVLKFDNTYSRTRSKVMHYVITLTSEQEAAETAIVVRTPMGSMATLNSSNGGGMATLGIPVPNYMPRNGSHSSLASSCCSCGSSTNVNGNAGEEKEFLDAVDDSNIPYLEADNNKKSIKSFF